MNTKSKIVAVWLLTIVLYTAWIGWAAYVTTPVRTYKYVHDGQEPYRGGFGSYAPLPTVDNQLYYWRRTPFEINWTAFRFSSNEPVNLTVCGGVKCNQTYFEPLGTIHEEYYNITEIGWHNYTHPVYLIVWLSQWHSECDFWNSSTYFYSGFEFRWIHWIEVGHWEEQYPWWYFESLVILTLPFLVTILLVMPPLISMCYEIKTHSRRSEE